MKYMKNNTKKILAVSSGGGHWIQLLRLSSAFAGHDVSYVTVNANYAKDTPGTKCGFYVVNDANRLNKIGLLIMGLKILCIIVKVKPNIVISTGAAPGYFALLFGKMLRSKTIWIDSIANAECLSLSGRKVRRYADLYLTQWPHLVKEGGPVFKGNVL